MPHRLYKKQILEQIKQTFFFFNNLVMITNRKCKIQNCLNSHKSLSKEFSIRQNQSE